MQMQIQFSDLLPPSLRATRAFADPGLVGELGQLAGALWRLLAGQGSRRKKVCWKRLGEELSIGF